jgi:hypothetical protein
MGYAGNPEPTYMVPTCIADHVDRKDVKIIIKLTFYLKYIFIIFFHEAYISKKIKL